MLDAEIREILFDYLDDKHSKIRILDEIVIGKARADLVAITDHLTGYEIKSDGDSYTRLPGQIKEYQRYFPYNYLVVGQRHRNSAIKKVPDYWGIICVDKADEKEQVEVLREAMLAPKFTLKWQMRLLWRRELVSIAVKNGLPKYSGKKKKYIWEQLMEKISEQVLIEQICEEFFERDYSIYK